jgi:hypothetical protein
VIVAIPGIAFAALKESKLPTEAPELWRRVETYSISLTRGKGLSVHLDLGGDDLRIIRDTLGETVRRLHAQPYAVRGMEGNVTMQSCSIAVGRLDDALTGRVGSES